MDTRLAIKLTQSFMDQLEADISSHLSQDKTLSKDNLTGKLLEKYLIYISKTKGIIKHEINLNKMKSHVLAVTFDKGTYHPGLERKERLLFASIQHFGLRSKSLRNPILFSLSHHCVQRMLERIPYNGPHNQESLRSFIFDEIDYLPIFTNAILNIELLASQILLDKENIDFKAILHVMKNIPIIVPTKHGVLIGQIIDTYIHISTFLSDAMLRPESIIQKERIVKTLEPFKNTHLIYWPKTYECYGHNKKFITSVLIDALAVKMTEEIERSLDQSKIQEGDKRRLKTLFRLIKQQNKATQIDVISPYSAIYAEKGPDAAMRIFEKDFVKGYRSPSD